MARRFAPLDATMLERIRAAAVDATPGHDPAHDFLHADRVAQMAAALARDESADCSVVRAAGWLHELFNYPKSHPDSSRSGDVCADRALELLDGLGLQPTIAARIADCIRVHAYSKGVVPDSLEARVLQDADRLDALGAIGIARCFATTAAMARPFYAPHDPFCTVRPPDDRAFGLDHFYRKLLGLGATMHTNAGRVLAAERVAFMHAFLAQLGREIAAPSSLERAQREPTLSPSE